MQSTAAIKLFNKQTRGEIENKGRPKEQLWVSIEKQINKPEERLLRIAFVVTQKGQQLLLLIRTISFRSKDMCLAKL